MALHVVEQAFLSDTGRQRAANEDSYFVASPTFVVADGMGGAQAGEVASRIAVEAFRSAAPRTESNPEAYLRRVILVANHAINAFAQRDSSRSGMGTTITAGLAEGEGVSFAHVGDSRAYRLRDGALSQLTRHHSLVEELRRRGRLTEQEAAEHPQRSIITRALGPEPQVEVDTVSYAASDGDLYLLCSDGLTTMVGDGQLAAIMGAGNALDETARRLVAAANAAGGRDNITVVLFRLGEIAGDDGAPVLEPAEAIGPAVAPDGPEAAVAATPDAAAAGSGPARAGAREQPADGTAPDREPRPAAAPAGAAARPGDGDGKSSPAAAGNGKAGRARRGGRRRLVVALVVAALIAALLTAGVYAVRQVYFLGGDESGRLALFRGLPFELPLGVTLYSEVETTGVPIMRIPADRRSGAVDHALRSQADARSLMSNLEDAADRPIRSR